MRPPVSAPRSAADSARAARKAAPYRLAFDRGSLRLEAPRGARVPDYFAWDARIRAWRERESRRLTEERRPDLMAGAQD